MLIVASGVKYGYPKVPGIEKHPLVSALDVVEGKATVGDRVVIWGGKMPAISAALILSEKGKKVKEKYDLMKSGFRREDVDQGRAELTQAQAALELARTRLGYATITSPANTVVLVRPAEPGQVVAVGGTVLTAGDLNNVWFEGWIPETDLAGVRHGQKAVVTTDTYPGKTYPAWVSYISSKAEFTPKTVETFKERVTLVYRTKIRVDNPNYELKPGMPAEAVVEMGN